MHGEGFPFLVGVWGGAKLCRCSILPQLTATVRGESGVNHKFRASGDLCCTASAAFCALHVAGNEFDVTMSCSVEGKCISGLVFLLVLWKCTSAVEFLLVLCLHPNCFYCCCILIGGVLKVGFCLAVFGDKLNSVAEKC